VAVTAVGGDGDAGAVTVPMTAPGLAASESLVAVTVVEVAEVTTYAPTFRRCPRPTIADAAGTTSVSPALERTVVKVPDA
jgi:hypothetical protein